MRRRDDVIKRGFDIVGAATLLAVFAPVVGVAAIAVRADSPGPAFYRQERVGQHGRPITILKLRTMRAGADDDLHRKLVTSLLTRAGRDGIGESERLFKVEDDPRVTRVGRVLRSTSIDELPQLLNVLRGEMSLVGPRPDVPYAVEQYEPWQRARLEVKPGITGLWQVSGRARLSPERMLQLDVDYVERRSMALDLAIVVRTVPAVLKRVGSQ